MKIMIAIFAALAITACSSTSTSHNKSGYMNDGNVGSGYSHHMETNNRKR